MLYGENLCAEEVVVTCACGLAAIIEVFDQSKISCGWFCRRHASKKRAELLHYEKIAKAIVRKGNP